jgi:D-glycero-D-manno-heptose 1,7-bisphosphate phosphatase
MLEKIHARMSELIGLEAEAHVDDFFYCPHHIGACSCRKPDAGMFYRAVERWPEIELGASAMVGDSMIDVEAAQKVGMRSIRLGADVPDLSSAVDRLLGERR